jgi:hypothetical protein
VIVNEQKGFALILVLVLMAMGAMTVTPALRLASTSLKSKAIHTEVLKDQYARDGAAEFAIWQLQYGDAITDINDEGLCPDNICTYEVVLNGITTSVIIQMRTVLGTVSVAGAEGDAIKPTFTVECSISGVAPFTDDCLALPSNTVGMVVKYTVSLEQLSPDVSVGIASIYSELPKGFDYQTGTVISSDSSFTETLSVTPTNIGSGQNQIWKWDFLAPVYFVQGEVKKFTFEAEINKSGDRYCTDIFAKMESEPHEQAGKKDGYILVGISPPEECDSGGVIIEKFVDTLVVQPGVETILTYVINIANLDGATEEVLLVKDVLPQGGFVFCDSGDVPVCDDPLYKVVDTPFNPSTDDFADTTNGWSTLNAPNSETLLLLSDGDRWELKWDYTNGSSPCAKPGGCNASGESLAWAGETGDTLIMRFQTSVTLETSGSYYNEVFVDVDCVAPQPLLDEEVTTSEDYCASYSWPSGGTLVPMYDVNSGAESTSGQGNVSVDVGGDTSMESWSVDDL